MGLAKNSRLLALAGPLMEQAATQLRATGDKQRCFTWITHGAGTRDKARPMIAKAEHDANGPNPRFLVTRLTGEAWTLYDDLYCQRGDMENRIKEQQLGLFADHTSRHDFAANQFRVLLSAAAYVPLEQLRRTAPAGTELAAAQISTLRLKLLKIGGRLVRPARRIVPHLAGGYPLQTLFHQIAPCLMPTPNTA